MRSSATTGSRTVLSMIFLLGAPLVRAQVINGESTSASHLQNRPSVDLEDSALVPKPQPRREDDDARPDRETDGSLYPSR